MFSVFRSFGSNLVNNDNSVHEIRMGSTMQQLDIWYLSVQCLWWAVLPSVSCKTRVEHLTHAEYM